MKALIGCEFSGVVRDTFIRKGWTALSCDILPSESNFGPHYQGDLRTFLYPLFHEKNTDGSYHNIEILIAHPPCTYLCNSGVRWLKGNKERWKKMEEAALFFKEILESPAFNKIAVENPIMHKYAIEIIGRRQDQVIQPWQFGHGETKATCLWLKNLPKLKPTKIVEGREQRLHLLPPSPDRAKLRSITYQGIANAMVDQWT